jgi:hypothetical protein
MLSTDESLSVYKSIAGMTYSLLYGVENRRRMNRRSKTIHEIIIQHKVSSLEYACNGIKVVFRRIRDAFLVLTGKVAIGG